MKNDVKFWDQLAEKYAAKAVPDQSIYEHKLSKTREYFDSDASVLEYGCGTGTTSLLHAPFVKNIVATDFSGAMVEIARRKAESQGVQNVQFMKEAADSLTFDTASFDVVMAHSILHLLRDPATAIKNTHKVLKQGGYFVSSTVCIEGGLSFLKYLLPLGYKLGLTPFVNCFSKHEFLSMIKEAGFEIEYLWQATSRDVFLVARKNSVE